MADDPGQTHYYGDGCDPPHVEPLDDADIERFELAIGIGECVLCNEPLAGESSSSLLQPMHRACALRSTIGGIGHLLDHQYFCVVIGDPDAGLDYRTSALLVDAWVARKGVEEAARK